MLDAIDAAKPSDAYDIADIVLERRSSLFFDNMLLSRAELERVCSRWIANPATVCEVLRDGQQIVAFAAGEFSSYAGATQMPVLKLKYLLSRHQPAGGLTALMSRLLRATVDRHSVGNSAMLSFIGPHTPAALAPTLQRCGFKAIGVQCVKFSLKPASQLTGSIRIEPLQPESVLELLTIADEFFGESNRTAMTNGFFDVKAIFRKVTDELSIDGVGFVARFGSKPIGFIVGKTQRLRGTAFRALKNSYWYVHPGSRGTHAAHGLLRHFEDAARQRQLDGVIISTSAGIANERTRLFLEAVGYVHVGGNYLYRLSA